MKRRTFLRSAAVSSLALTPASQVLAALAPDNKYRQNIGIQLYTLRGPLGKDPAGTLQARGRRLLAAAGRRHQAGQERPPVHVDPCDRGLGPLR